jgi:hypothetical protein
VQRTLPENPRKTGKSPSKDFGGVRLALSFKISKIVIGKGKTTTDEKQSEWVRRYYEVEAIVQDEHAVEVTKASIEGLIDGWLTNQRKEPAETWNPAKIKWTEEEGFKGKYERSEDVNNPEFKAMLKDLQQHKGRLTREAYFYWVFENGSTVGRKQMEKKTGQQSP